MTNALSVMNTERLKELCRTLPGATERPVAPPTNVLVYAVGDKNFAYFKTSEPEKWRFSFRVTPERFVELTDVPGVKPARYMGRYHWVTIVEVHKFPTDYLVELVEWSYRKAFNALTKAKRLAINPDVMTSAESAPEKRSARR
jgi:predicted DNA-binding protein (MmcQ/YjbR family)